MKRVRSASRAIVTRGKSMVMFDLIKNPPDDETLRKAILGPFGNLRAPVLQRGRTIVVGFSEAAYRAALRG